MTPLLDIFLNNNEPQIPSPLLLRFLDDRSLAAVSLTCKSAFSATSTEREKRYKKYGLDRLFKLEASITEHEVDAIILRISDNNKQELLSALKNNLEQLLKTSTNDISRYDLITAYMQKHLGILGYITPSFLKMTNNKLHLERSNLKTYLMVLYSLESLAYDNNFVTIINSVFPNFITFDDLDGACLNGKSISLRIKELIEPSFKMKSLEDVFFTPKGKLAFSQANALSDKEKNEALSSSKILIREFQKQFLKKQAIYSCQII